jgi:hypothetical protein
MSMKSYIFWNITLCSAVKFNQYFRGTSPAFLLGLLSTLKIEMIVPMKFRLTGYAATGPRGTERGSQEGDDDGGGEIRRRTEEINRQL